MKMPEEPDRLLVPLPLPADNVSEPGQLLSELRKAHEAVREAMELKLEVARAPDFTATHCALLRWKMSRARHWRSKVLLRAIVELLKDASPGEAAALRQLQLDELNVSRCCAAHLQRWTAEAIALDRDAYAFAAAQFCAAFGERLSREAQVLYPMLSCRTRGRAQAPKEVAMREAWASRAVS